MATLKYITIVLESLDEQKFYQILSILNFNIEYYFKNGQEINFEDYVLEDLLKENDFALQLTFNKDSSINLKTQIFCAVNKIESFHALSFSLNQIFEDEKKMMKDYFVHKIVEFPFKNFLFIDNNEGEEFIFKVVSFLKSIPNSVEKISYNIT